MDFLNFSCTTLQENAKVLDVRILCHAFVLLLLYYVKVSDTISNTFHAILAPCTCSYQSNLGKPVWIKWTKLLPFTRTHTLKRPHHCAIVAAMMEWSSSIHSSADILSTPSHHGSADGRPSLERYSDTVVHQIQIRRWIQRTGWPHLWGWTLAFLSAALWQCHVTLTCTVWFHWRQHYVTR